ERPERLPMFDPLVEFIFYLGVARVRQDAAIAERARPELGTALKPSKHVAFSQQSCRVAADTLAGRVDGLQTNEPFAGGRARIVIRIGSAEIGVRHDR